MVEKLDVPEWKEILSCAKTIADDLSTINEERVEKGKKHQLTKPLKNAIQYARMIATADPKVIERRDKIGSEKSTVIARRLAVSLQDWTIEAIKLDPNSDEYEEKKNTISRCKKVINQFGNL